MRSRRNRLAGAPSAILLTLLLTTAVHAQPPAASQAARPDEQSIARAIEQVKADPNLATERTIRILQWRSGPEKPSRLPGWLRWIVGLVRWLAQSGRALVWVSAAVLAGFLAVFIVRLLGARADARTGRRPATPTHVQDLDIRPESLPADIGAAARALWDRGERRAALALLYRGLLSRLAHVHAVPIRDSTTEGACLTLAAAHLTEERHEFASRLVRIWQRTVYGGQDADTAAVYSLCAGFGPTLDPAPAAGAPPQP